MKVGEDQKRKCTDVKSYNRDIAGNQTTQSNGHYGFISYFGATVRQMKATNANATITREVRREIATSFKNLPPKTKWKYRVQVKRAVKGEATNNFVTRCAPDRLAATISNLSDEQRAAICEMGLGSMLQLNCGRLKRKLCGWLVDRVDVGRCVLVLNGDEVELSGNSFGHIMGLKDGGMPIQLEGDITEVESYLQMFGASSRGINIKKLAEILSNSTAADDRFKVTFMLFTLCTVLCPPGGVHISSSFLFSLKDVNCIQKRNWATFCFHRFIQGITRYKEEKLAYIGGCLLYLEMLYFSSILYGKVQRDRSMCPLALWNVDEIKRLLKWIDNKGGYGSDEIRINAAALIGANSRSDGCNMSMHEDVSNGESGDMAEVPGMMKVQWVNILQKPISTLSSPSGSIKNLKTPGSCSNDPGNKGTGKHFSEAVDNVGRYNACESKELYDGAVYGGPYINNKADEEEDCEHLRQTNSVNFVNTNVNTGPSPPCPDRLHSDKQIEQPILMQKYCLPTKRLAAELHHKPAVINIRGEAARYRVGPYLIRRPFMSDEEMLINFCMDDNLNKGEMVFKTNFNCLTRNDVLSLSPRTTINGKIVSAVSELLSAQATVNVGHSHCSIFLPSFNALEDDVGAMPTDLTLAIKQSISGDLFLSNIGNCKKIFIPVNDGFTHWSLLVVLISEMRVEIWDPLPSAMTTNSFLIEWKRALNSVEMAFHHCGLNYITGSTSLRDFPFEFCSRQPSIHHEYDCGLYVLLMMERHKIWSCLTESEIKFDSDSERARIVIELMTYAFNCLKADIRLLAENHQLHLDDEARSICEAIDQRRLRQLRRSKQMGHGRRH